MEIKKFLHTNKGFFLLSLVAAIIGTIASIFFSGCSKVEEPSEVITSKRVKIDVQEVIPDEIVMASNTSGDNSSAAASAKKKRVESKKAVTSEAKPRVKTAARTTTAKRATRKAQRSRSKKTSVTHITKTWAVNVASFTKPADARRLKAKLLSTGRYAYITEFTKGGTLYYRVRVGFYATRDRAKKEGRAISSSFRNTGDAWVTRPGKTELKSHSR